MGSTEATQSLLICSMTVLHLSSPVFPYPVVNITGLLNVTGYAGSNAVENFTVVYSRASWIDAFMECKSMSLSLPLAVNNGNKFVHLRNHLFLNHEQFIGEPLWTGFLKPNLDGVWYSEDDCLNPADQSLYDKFQNTNDSQRQCILIDMSENSKSVNSIFYAASCLERHSFICSKSIGQRPMTEYNGTRIQSYDSKTSIQVELNTTTSQCTGKCKHMLLCFYAEFNCSSKDCHIYKRPVLDLPVEFILESASDIISFVKSEENPVYVVNLNSTKYNVTYNEDALPCYAVPNTTADGEIYPTPTADLTCYQTTLDICTNTATITSTFTSAVSSNQQNIEQLLNDVRVKNSLDVKTLSAYQNRFISADDNSSFSKTVGFIGVLCICLVCILIILSDIPVLIRDIGSSPENLGRQANQRKTRKHREIVNDNQNLRRFRRRSL